jgi:hypothetical protein
MRNAPQQIRHAQVLNTLLAPVKSKRPGKRPPAALGIYLQAAMERLGISEDALQNAKGVLCI